jgi:hypothetical protein
VDIPLVQEQRVFFSALLFLSRHKAQNDSVHAAAEFYPNLAPAGITGLILIEPTLVTRELFNEHFQDRMSQMEFSISATSSRRDRWKSKAEALLYFQKRFPWNMWDPKVLRCYAVRRSLSLSSERLP